MTVFSNEVNKSKSFVRNTGHEMKQKEKVIENTAQDSAAALYVCDGLFLISVSDISYIHIYGIIRSTPQE